MAIVKDRKRVVTVGQVSLQGADQVIVAQEHGRHESNTVSAAASGAAVGAVAGFAVLPGAGGLIGSVAGGIAGLLIGLATDAAHEGDDQDDQAA